MKFLESYPKEVKIFLAASLINSAGGSLMWPLTTMYIFDELGRSMTDAGLVVMIQAFGGIIGQLLGGALYHRVGVKRLIVGSLALCALGLFSLPFISSYWVVYMIIMGFIGLCNAVSMPAIQAFVGFRFADRRGELFNVIYVANNIGVALGTALSGFLADVSYHLTFVLNGVTSAVFALFFLNYLNQLDKQEGPVHLERKSKTGAKESIPALLGNTRIYLYLGLGSMFLWLGNSIWNTGVSPHIISEGLPKRAYGFLWTLNGILIFAAQPVTTWIKRKFAKESSAQMTASGIFYLLAYVVILLLPGYAGLLFAMVLATLGEMLVSPAVPAFISDHAYKTAPFYIGVAGGMAAFGRMIGPYFMGILYDHGGLVPVTWLSIAIAIMAVASFVIHSLHNRAAERSLSESIGG
ncbi:MFS transporter [Paenibacillus sp.]|jgi:MFS family permease|uniref:MFS transporter n=1 Tax=Paenibacillus sp. TaxID=58172 RepID=UPI002827CFE4|nr:MFS transporter [Paenibacillus sp.]MDR0269298.1 MFS transporter [Paenibacillus sp.]